MEQPKSIEPWSLLFRVVASVVYVVVVRSVADLADRSAAAWLAALAVGAALVLAVDGTVVRPWLRRRLARRSSERR